MNTHDYFKDIQVLPEGAQASVRGYLVGLALSVAATVGSYVLVLKGDVSTSRVMLLVLALALIQFLAQATYFLHVRRASHEGRERFVALCSFSIIVAIVVVGSLWVMVHLDERMMTPAMQMEYMQTH